MNSRDAIHAIRIPRQIERSTVVRNTEIDVINRVKIRDAKRI